MEEQTELEKYNNTKLVKAFGQNRIKFSCFNKHKYFKVRSKQAPCEQQMQF